MYSFINVIYMVYIKRAELRAKILLFLEDGRAYSTRRIQKTLGVDRRTLLDTLKDLYFKHMVSFFERNEYLGSGVVPIKVRYWFRPDMALKRVKEEMELIKLAQKKEEVTPEERVIGTLGSGNDKIIKDGSDSDG